MNFDKHGRIAVLGLGGGGGKIASTLASDKNTTWLDIAAVNTDQAELKNCENLVQILIGSTWNHHQGCGGSYKDGQKAAQEDAHKLISFIQSVDILIVVTTLGGGTGSGAASIIAQQARSQNTMTLFFVTEPFAMEGNARFRNSEKSLKVLHDTADAVILLNNDSLFKSMSGNIQSNFENLNTLIANCLYGIAELSRNNGFIPIDFAHIKQLLGKKDAKCRIALGTASCNDKITVAINELIHSPLLGGVDKLQEAHSAIISLSAGDDLTLEQLNECIEKIKTFFHEDCELTVGLSSGQRRDNRFLITILSIHYDEIEKVKDDLYGTSQGIEKVLKKKTATRKMPQNKKLEETLYNIQGELELTEMTTGQFSSSAPSNYFGENHDIPTFMRKGIVIDSNL